VYVGDVDALAGYGCVFETYVDAVDEKEDVAGGGGGGCTRANGGCGGDCLGAWLACTLDEADTVDDTLGCRPWPWPCPASGGELPGFTAELLGGELPGFPTIARGGELLSFAFAACGGERSKLTREDDAEFDGDESGRLAKVGSMEMPPRGAGTACGCVPVGGGLIECAG